MIPSRHESYVSHKQQDPHYYSPSHHKAVQGRVYDAFLQGYDTYDIALRFGFHESVALYLINKERAVRQRWLSPYFRGRAA